MNICCCWEQRDGHNDDQVSKSLNLFNMRQSGWWKWKKANAYKVKLREKWENTQIIANWPAYRGQCSQAPKFSQAALTAMITIYDNSAILEGVLANIIMV